MECPARQASREVKQIQQMFNMDKDQAMLQTPLMDYTPTAFLPFSQKLGGNNKKAEVDRNDSLGKNCLSSKQTEYIYIQECRVREFNQ